MKVIVNGREQELSAGETVTGLLEEIGHCGPYTLVELNGEPLERERYGSVALRDGDAVVVAGPVAGG
jgi:thiamine biosynthesis protein ThiS